jgi:Flp pilus assembly CpaE family ATPase
MATYLNIKPECTLNELLDREHLDTQTIKQALLPLTPKLSVLCGPYREIVVRDSSERPITPFDTLSVTEALRHLAPTVVVDLPAWFDETYFEVLRKADKIVLVVEQTVSSLHNLQMLERALALNERQTLEVVVNRYDPRVKGLSLEKIQQLSKGAIRTLGSDPAMVAAANEGRLLRDAAPRSRLSAEIDELAGFLAKIPVQPKNAGFWEKILGRSGQHVAEGG